MEILGIGPLELLLILLIALIAVGPRDLGKAARSTGRLLNQLYKSDVWQNLNEASRSIRTLPNRLAREAHLEELEQVKREIEAQDFDASSPMPRETSGGEDSPGAGNDPSSTDLNMPAGDSPDDDSKTPTAEPQKPAGDDLGSEADGESKISPAEGE